MLRIKCLDGDIELGEGYLDQITTYIPRYLLIILRFSR